MLKCFRPSSDNNRQAAQQSSTSLARHTWSNPQTWIRNHPLWKHLLQFCADSRLLDDIHRTFQISMWRNRTQIQPWEYVVANFSHDHANFSWFDWNTNTIFISSKFHIFVQTENINFDSDVSRYNIRILNFTEVTGTWKHGSCRATR